MVRVCIDGKEYLVTYHGMNAEDAWKEAHWEFDPFQWQWDAGVAYGK